MLTGKDGKEGAPVDIQSILNGTAKFCRHCDVVILGSMITKKASVFGLVGGSADDQSEDDDDIHFCSSACFVQFAVTHRVGGVGNWHFLFFFIFYFIFFDNYFHWPILEDPVKESSRKNSVLLTSLTPSPKSWKILKDPERSRKILN